MSSDAGEGVGDGRVASCAILAIVRLATAVSTRIILGILLLNVLVLYVRKGKKIQGFLARGFDVFCKWRGASH
jgi:hypothetical protein